MSSRQGSCVEAQLPDAPASRRGGHASGADGKEAFLAAARCSVGNIRASVVEGPAQLRPSGRDRCVLAPLESEAALNPSEDGTSGEGRQERDVSPLIPKDSAWATSRPTWPGEEDAEEASETGERWRRYPMLLTAATLVASLAFMLPAFAREPGRVWEVLMASGLGLLAFLTAIMAAVALLSVFYRARWASVLAGTVGILVSLALFFALTLLSLTAYSLDAGFLGFWGIGWWLLGLASAASFILAIFVAFQKE